MKKLIVLMVVMCVALPAGAALVNTTFEPNSAGEGTWDTGHEWGDADAGAGNNDPDPASMVKWLNNTSYQQVVGGGEAYSGTACGRLTGSGTSEKYAKLDFADGGNTGEYLVTWYQKTAIRVDSGNRYSYFMIMDDSAKKAARIQVNPGNGNIEIYDGSGFTTIMAAVADTWYEFEMTLDYSTKKFDIKAREAGSTDDWSTALNQDFYDADSASLDRVYGYGRSDSIYGYFDDIKIVPEPATMVLLSLGSLLVLKRRRS
ncbi:MAG: PEP-CTERM sorting domain-containing protein [Anaerohalosphaeraceae bacterium]|nr:PEP-CTERM sorting domain-containing protein [Anaerohalosphaeraceae bacterium]